MKYYLTTVFLLFGFLSVACKNNGSCPDGKSASANYSKNVSAVTGGGWYKPAKTVTWQWQLSGTVNTAYAVEIYDIDLFDTTSGEIAALQGAGKKVICYFSAGSYENWRSDKSDFDKTDLGNPLDGWDGEKWLDIRSKNVFNIMKARLDLAVQKGCDGVEPDNVDVHTQDSCFNISASEMIAYNRNLANAAHNRNLAVALKNDPDQMSSLVDYYDFSISEQCNEYSECASYQPMLDANKPVLNAEYRSLYKTNGAARTSMCNDSNAQGIRTLILDIDLDDSYRFSCF
ncbi:MAG: endo alpha-1,4 polygalactosaminidase [Leptospirales bacterium]